MCEKVCANTWHYPLLYTVELRIQLPHPILQVASIETAVSLANEEYVICNTEIPR